MLNGREKVDSWFGNGAWISCTRTCPGGLKITRSRALKFLSNPFFAWSISAFHVAGLYFDIVRTSHSFCRRSNNTVTNVEWINNVTTGK